MRSYRALLLSLILSLSGCDLVGPDGPADSCDHAWSSRDLTRLTCAFDSKHADTASR